MYEHNALGYWSGLALCLTKVRSSRARCPATALINYAPNFEEVEGAYWFGSVRAWCESVMRE